MRRSSATAHRSLSSTAMEPVFRSDAGGDVGGGGRGTSTNLAGCLSRKGGEGGNPTRVPQTLPRGRPDSTPSSQPTRGLGPTAFGAWFPPLYSRAFRLGGCFARLGAPSVLQLRKRHMVRVHDQQLLDPASQ